MSITETNLLLIVFVVLLVAFPLFSIGTMQDLPLLWWIALGLVILGGVVPPVARYVYGDDDDD